MRLTSKSAPDNLCIFFICMRKDETKLQYKTKELKSYILNSFHIITFWINKSDNSTVSVVFVFT